MHLGRTGDFAYPKSERRLPGHTGEAERYPLISVAANVPPAAICDQFLRGIFSTRPTTMAQGPGDSTIFRVARDSGTGIQRFTEGKWSFRQRDYVSSGDSAKDLGERYCVE